MKLLVTKINSGNAFELLKLGNSGNAFELIKLVKQFYCIANEQENGEMIITKNPELTDDEFSLLAGKLVISGFKVELL